MKELMSNSFNISKCTTLFLVLFFHLSTTVLTNAQSNVTFPLTSKATKCLVDSLSNQITKFYVHKDAAIKISAYLKQRVKDGSYAKINDPHLLAGMLTSDVLSVYKDEHFHVEFNPELANEVSGNVEDVPKMVAKKLQHDREMNFGFKRAEVLNGNIGYLEISAFSRLNRYSKATADAALQMLSNSKALIIDLRYGVGGSPEMLTHILSHFFKERTHVSNIFIRSENLTLPYYTSPDSSYEALFTIPVYVLTSYKTFSAAEGLAYTLQSFKRATIIGEKTRGGAHTVTYRPLSCGFVADIPFGESQHPLTKKSWEGIGITPDIITLADEALEVAERKIVDEALKAANDSLEQQKIKWHFEILQSKNHPYYLDSLSLKQFVGDYGIYSVTYKSGTLYYQKTGKAKFPLIPVNATTFRPKSNDSFKLVFINDENGKPQHLHTYYEDGRFEFAERTM